MNCRDFEPRCQDWLDARSTPAPDLDRGLESHAATCSSCRPILLHYQVLRQAIASLGPPPSLPPGLADRVLAMRTAPPVLAFPQPRGFRRWGVAAAVVLAGGLGLRFIGRPHRERPGPVTTATTPVVVRPLGEALADATSATLELARVTSEPAARIGRQVIDSASLPEPPWPSSSPTAPVAGTAEVLQSVGQRVHSGVRPLSGAARQAFGFLLPTPARDETRNGA